MRLWKSTLFIIIIALLVRGNGLLKMIVNFCEFNGGRTFLQRKLPEDNSKFVESRRDATVASPQRTENHRYSEITKVCSLDSRGFNLPLFTKWRRESQRERTVNKYWLFVPVQFGPRRANSVGATLKKDFHSKWLRNSMITIRLVEAIFPRGDSRLRHGFGDKRGSRSFSVDSTLHFYSNRVTVIRPATIRIIPYSNILRAFERVNIQFYCSKKKVLLYLYRSNNPDTGAIFKCYILSSADSGHADGWTVAVSRIDDS